MVVYRATKERNRYTGGANGDTCIPNCIPNLAWRRLIERDLCDDATRAATRLCTVGNAGSVPNVEDAGSIPNVEDAASIFFQAPQ